MERHPNTHSLTFQGNRYENSNIHPDSWHLGVGNDHVRMPRSGSNHGNDGATLTSKSDSRTPSSGWELQGSWTVFSGGLGFPEHDHGEPTHWQRFGGSRRCLARTSPLRGPRRGKRSQECRLQFGPAGQRGDRAGRSVCSQCRWSGPSRLSRDDPPSDGRFGSDRRLPPDGDQFADPNFQLILEEARRRVDPTIAITERVRLHPTFSLLVSFPTRGATGDLILTLLGHSTCAT